MGLIDLIFKKQMENNENIAENDIILHNTKDNKTKAKKSMNTTNDEIDKCSLNTNNINVYTPKNMQEIERIVVNLQKNEASIINLKGIEKVDYLKILDFLNGATFALNGSINRLTKDLYLISPKNLQVKTLK